MGATGGTPLQDSRFLLLEALGRGGMGRVYRAFDRNEQRLVALKVLSNPEQPGPAHPLSSEFEAWSRLRHPNIVEAYELGVARCGPIDSGTPYLVLEHVHGGPVHRMLRPGNLTPRIAEGVAEQLLLALSLVHATGYVHRDLKPGNVLVQPGSPPAERIKLTDFGLAVPKGRVGGVGMFSGSLPYASPEALLGMPLDDRADLYGLGVLLYRLTTGELPMPSDGVEAIVRWHLSGPQIDTAFGRQSLSGRLGRFIRRLTARDPNERPESADEALRMLGVRSRSIRLARPPMAGRAARANLRLALDAVRLGANRVFRLPCSREAAAALTQEISIWAQVRGLTYCHLPGGGSPGGLSRLVLRLLMEPGSEAALSISRFGLRRHLPLDLLGGLPILDRFGAVGRTSAAGDEAVGEAASGIRDFLLSCAERQPLVLGMSRSSLEEPLVAELARQLARSIDDTRRPASSRGGLLLLLEPNRSGDGAERRSVRPGTPTIQVG